MYYDASCAFEYKQGEETMRFSQRYGYTPVKDVIQLESMDSDLRNSLWNALEIFHWERLKRYMFLPNTGDESIQQLCRDLWANFFKWPLDAMPQLTSDIHGRLREVFFESAWQGVYDFVEFIAQADISPHRSFPFKEKINEFLEREVAGYRLVDGYIVQITDANEIDEIEIAIAGESQAVSNHLNTALAMLSDRQNPDYRNSIKESISAVEGQVRSSLETDKGTLGDLLKQLEKKEPLHSALRQAFSQLYGYTADESGIRHALIEEGRDIPFEEAKFMLVVCSAFVNYVRGVTKS